MHPRLIWRAFATMMRTAARNPVWAVGTVLLSPIHALRYLVGVVFVFCAVALPLSLLARFALAWARVPKPSLVHDAAYLGVGLVTILVTVRVFVAPMVLRFGFVEDSGDTHGSARFATPSETHWLARDTGLLIGRDTKSGRLMRYPGPAHLLTIAPTRTGKGVSTIIPNLLDYGGSVVCIDPKGENARVTARQRARFGPVHVLDPFGVTGLASTALNPLDRIDPHGLDVADDCMTLADAIVHDNTQAESETHWNEEAKALIAGLLLHVATVEPPATRNLGTLRELLTLDAPGFVAVLGDMQKQDGLVARAANRQLGKSDREAAGVLSTAQRHTHFLDSPRMTAVLGRSDFRLADLKAGTSTVFLVLPPDRLGSYARWLRLMVAQGLTELVRAPGQPARPILFLFLLDEFAALGHLEPVERAMGLMAGYGVQLWPIL